MTEAPKVAQYNDSRNLRTRGNLHARYANRSWIKWVAEQINLLPGSDILDIGCGAGWFWSSASSQLPIGLRLRLVDTSEGMMTEALRQLSGNSHFAEVVGRTADAVALPFADQAFDAAVAMHMLYHVPTPEKALDEMARVLRPDGLAVITTNGDGNFRELFNLSSQAFGTADSDPAATLFGVDAARALLAQRFGTVTVHVFEDTYAIDNAEDVLLYLTSFPPGIDVSERQKNEARHLIAECLGQNDGVLKVKREGAVVRGR